jgi:hypothetical protein
MYPNGKHYTLENGRMNNEDFRAIFSRFRQPPVQVDEQAMRRAYKATPTWVYWVPDEDERSGGWYCDQYPPTDETEWLARYHFDHAGHIYDNMIQMTDEENPCEYPEDFLWVFFNECAEDGTLGVILSVERLQGLLTGDSKPTDQTEEILVANPDWVRTYLTYYRGNYVIQIPQDGPLPVFTHPID